MKTIVPLRFLFTVGQVLLHARTCIEVHSHRVRTGVLPLIARRNRFGVAVVKYVLSPPEVMAALPPRDAINTQIATTKFLGTTSTNIYASRYQSRLVFPLFSRYLERISDWNREWYSDLITLDRVWKFEFIEFEMDEESFYFFSQSSEGSIVKFRLLKLKFG